MAETKRVLNTSDLIFSQAATVSVHGQLASIKKSTLSVSNRLRSIERDADFVRWVVAHYSRGSVEPSHYGGYDGVYEPPAPTKQQSARSLLPVIANERCGSWYIHPAEKTGGSGYWKSTDGHWGVWSFSLRRLNLGVFDVLRRSLAEGSAKGCGGAVVIDSTRQGKQLSDAFSKTVPIWCAIINRLLFPEADPKHHSFNRCDLVVSKSEAAQVESKLPFLTEAAGGLKLDLDGLRDKLSKPVQCFWIARGLASFPPTPFELLQLEQKLDPAVDQLRFHPLYLCMASEYQESATASSYTGYVQGAGDDAEAWAHGLTPQLFWEHHEELDSCSTEEQLILMIQTIIKDVARQSHDFTNTFRETCSLMHGDLRIGAATGPIITVPGLGGDDQVIVCSQKKPDQILNCPDKRWLHLKCGPGKVGSRGLRGELEKIGPFISQAIGVDRSARIVKRLVVCCDSGKDLSVGVALVVLCAYTKDEHTVGSGAEKKSSNVDKNLVRQKLGVIMAAAPSVNPSRTTLNSVNSFLMKP